MRYFNLAVLLAAIAIVAMAGWRGHRFSKPPFEIFPDMNYQPKVKDQQPSTFFADGLASRPPVDGTVAEEMPPVLDYWATGKYDASHWGDGIPVHAARGDAPALGVTSFDIARGRERYTINCAVCHGAAGDGKGITSQYGINATSYQSDRIRTMNDGEIFNTITNGKGQMMGYGYNIAIDDRWRIIMYIRALQHAQNAQLQEASPEEQQELNAAKNKTTDNFQIKYLDRHTMVGWMDSQELNLGGSLNEILSARAAAEASGVVKKDAVKITGPDDFYPYQYLRADATPAPNVHILFLNQQTMHFWPDSTKADPLGKAMGQ
jgi:mono/diheme cytochrome c family protein